MEKNRLIRIYGTSLIEKDGKILLQQEGNELTYGKWYFPSGRMDEKEFILDCVIRETFEETGYNVEPKYLIGIYQYEFNKGDQLVENINFVFAADIISGSPKISDEVLDIKWFQIDEINEMIKTGKIRNSNFFQSVIKDYQKSNKYPLEIIKHINKLLNYKNI
jgi:8-oxo-dGTP pyrophosphatase MutT (NUDIX family)